MASLAAPSTAPSELVASGPRRARPADAVRERFERLLGQSVLVFDGVSGNLVDRGTGPLRQPERFEPLMRTVAQSGTAACLEAEGAVAIWAIPAAGAPTPLVVVAALASDVARLREPDIRAALRCDSKAAMRWEADIAVWPHGGLEAFLQTLAENEKLRTRESELAGETEYLSEQLGRTFEELTVIHELATHLRIEIEPEDLCRPALNSLEACVPAKTLAVVLEEADQPDIARQVLWAGEPLAEPRIRQVIDRAAAALSADPLVVNDPSAEHDELANAVFVAVRDGNRRAGVLAALGLRGDGEFGTVEANLLHSVAGMLGVYLGNRRSYRETCETFEGAVRALTSAIDAKDPYTCGHSNRVAELARCIGLELGLDESAVETIYMAGLLHDIGKIGVDDRVLRKAGPLNDEEFEHIKRHPELGYQILRDVAKFADILPGVRHHHEAWDGSGYPAGLAGDEIPLIAQILAVADSFDAMTSDRPYRKGMPLERVDKIFREERGEQWAAPVVDAFFACRPALEQIVAGDRREDPGVSLAKGGGPAKMQAPESHLAPH